MGIEFGSGGSSRPRRGEQEVASFQIKGWMAVPAILIVIGLLAYRATSARSALTGPQGEKLRNHLQGVYVSHTLPNLRSAQALGADKEVSRLAKEAMKTDHIEFSDVRVKGTGDEVVAKVTITVGGSVPPDGKSVRYFLLRHKLGEWRVAREVGSFHYYAKLF